MALKDDAQTAAPAFGGTTDPSGGAPMGGAAAPQKWSFFTAPNLGGISREPTSENLVKAVKKLEEQYKEKISLDPQYQVDVLPVDRNKETALHLSGIIIAVRRKDAKDLGVSYHTLLIESTNVALAPIVQNIANVPVQVDRFASDVMNGKYAAIADEIVRKAFPGYTVRANAAQVVPRIFDWENDKLVRDLAVNAVYPSITDLEIHDNNFQDIDLTMWSHDSQLQVQLNFNDPDRTDYSGLPVRNNLTVALAAVANRKDEQNQINSQESTKAVSYLGGFIDLIWAPDAPNPQAQYYGAPQGPNYKFGARFVITNLENVLRMTPASQEFALLTALALRENNGWFPYFQPRPLGSSGKVIDLRDIGAINYEANIFNEAGGYGSKIDTKTAAFNNPELGRLLSAAIRPGLTYSLDVSECGSDTWYNEVFAAAAAGSQEATRMILNAADILTGGHFSKIYNSAESPVFVNNDRIHLGYYTGYDGLKHDIRDLDYLAVLNRTGDTDKGAAQAWSDTFLRVEYPIERRLAERKKMIVELLGDVTFTGFARRVTFTARFLEALSAAAKAAGLETRITSSVFGTDFTSQRAAAGFLGQSSVTMGSSGLFNQGYTTAQPQFGAGSVFGQRWR